MIFTIYSFIFLITALVALVVAALAWGRRSTKGAKELAILMCSAAYWSFAVMFESMATVLEMKVLWSKISYLAVVTTPILYLIFVYRFIGRKPLPKLGNILHLMIVPLIVLVLAWTNEHHHLIWTKFSPINEVSNLIIYYHGIAFFIGYMGFNYVLMFWGTILLLLFIFKHQDTFRSQGWLVLIASICPWVASIFYMSGVNIADGFDLTPGSISVSGLLFIFAILRMRLLDLVPIAREALVENLLEGIVVLDDQDRVQDMNQTAKKQLGLEQELVMGEYLQHLKIRVKVLSDAILTQESCELFEVQDGEREKAYIIDKIPLKTKPVSRLIVVRDVTESEEKRKEIQRSSEQYQRLYSMFRLLADNMPDMLWAKDLEKRYIFVNKAICTEMLHVSDTEEPIGKTFEYFLERQKSKNPDDPDWFNFGRNSKVTDDFIMETGQPGVFDELGTIEGRFAYMDVHKAPILDENGKMLGIVGSSRDVTLQKKAELELIVAKERAEESDRLKSAFLANISHEIRTPMNSVLGFLDLLQEPGVTSEERQDYHKAVRQNSDRLLDTINDIIELSKIDSGEKRIESSETDLGELFMMLTSVYSREAKEKGLEFFNTVQEPLGRFFIYCDRTKLFDVIKNLLKNAVKYTSKGFIEIGCTPKDGGLLFYVKDTGIGIPESRQKAIFERFVQVDGSSTRTYEGSGLGLSLSKAYVEMMGGTIWVESKLQEGSTFFFELPLHSV